MHECCQHCFRGCRSSLVSLSPPSRTFTAPVSPVKPSALQVIPPTRLTASSVCCHQGGDCGVSRRGPADWRTASYIRLSGSWTPSRPCPLSPLLPHAPLNSDTTTPPPPQLPTSPGPPPPLTNCDPHQSLCAALDWSLPHPALTVNYLFWQSDKRLFSELLSLLQTDKLFLHYTLYLHSFVYLTGLHSICHVPYVTLSISFFSTMSSFVYLYSLYVHMFKLYLSVSVCLLSVFNVNCMHQGSESYAISILCMYVLYMWQNWQ